MTKSPVGLTNAVARLHSGTPLRSLGSQLLVAGLPRGQDSSFCFGECCGYSWDRAEKFSNAGKEAAPLLYTRLDDQGMYFEPERNLITYAVGLDGGSSIAADSKGNVYAVWHAAQPGKIDDEANRAVFVARLLTKGIGLSGHVFGHATPPVKPRATATGQHGHG